MGLLLNGGTQYMVTASTNKVKVLYSLLCHSPYFQDLPFRNPTSLKPVGTCGTRIVTLSGEGMHIQLLRDLVLGYYKATIFERPWWLRKVLEAWKTARVTHFPEGQRGRHKELQATWSHLQPWQGDGANNPESHFQKHQVISQHEFTEQDSCLKSLIAYHN